MQERVFSTEEVVTHTSPRTRKRGVSLVRCGLMNIFILVAGHGCGGAQRQFSPPPPGDENTSVGVGDRIAVHLYGEEELAEKSFSVARDGTINYPFIGGVDVEGLEPNRIAERLATRLKEAGVFRDPQVSVRVEEYNSKKISVVGAVTKPSTLPMSAGMTLVQAISVAGGVTSIAAQNQTVISRKVQGKVRRFSVPLEDISKGRAADVPLHPGDLIFVPERVF